MSRIGWDEYFLNIAKVVSKRSTCLKRQYGSVIVDKNKILISSGYNGSPKGKVNCCDRGYCKRLDVPHNSGQYDECDSVHAEMNSIISASRIDMIGATLYLYGEENGHIINSEPCPICRRMIQNAGIERIVTSKGDTNE